VDTVFHTAAVAGIWGRWSQYYETNVVGTQNVLDACGTHQVQRLVYTSSPSVTFDADDQCGVDESAPYASRWICHYPHSKALAEQRVLAADGSGGLSTCALRPHLIWGPRDPHLVPRLVQRARSRRLRQVGDGSNRVDMIYVDNAAQAHWQAAEALAAGTAGGKAYFISQGEPVVCWQWINQILELADVAPVNRRISFPAAWRLGAALEWLYTCVPLPGEPPMTRFLAAQLAKSHYFSMDRARQDLGFQPRVSTAEGMRRLAEWLKSQS
jgi:nucleoside-diphosphate-sugar epimerase